MNEELYEDEIGRLRAQLVDYRARVDAEMARLRDAAWERFDNAEVEERAIAKLAFNEIDAARERLRGENQ